MAPVTPPTLDQRHLTDQHTIYNHTKLRCMARLNADNSVMILIVTGRIFYSRGPATEKAFSPNFDLVRGMTNSLAFADRSLPRPEIIEVLVLMSAM